MHRETTGRPFTFQQRHISLAVVAKVKVLAHHYVAGSQFTDQHPLDK
jgi:hypothetical protein